MASINVVPEPFPFNAFLGCLLRVLSNLVSWLAWGLWLCWPSWSTLGQLCILAMFTSAWFNLLSSTFATPSLFFTLTYLHFSLPLRFLPLSVRFGRLHLFLVYSLAILSTRQPVLVWLSLLPTRVPLPPGCRSPSAPYQID
ncbi:hypothetical protein M408DRAFT_334361, partial [Serendipita vermifera MAFF 305830]